MMIPYADILIVLIFDRTCHPEKEKRVQRYEQIGKSRQTEPGADRCQ